MQLLKEKYLTNKDINFLSIKKKNMITFIKSKEPQLHIIIFPKEKEKIFEFFLIVIYIQKPAKRNILKFH